MTIAVGLLCKEGVLLCADTEHVSWQTKDHESKIHSVTFPGGRSVFAYAGNDRFAISAIQKCAKRLKVAARLKKFDPQSEIEAVLDKEYRRNVLSHPSQDSDISLHYEFLVAVWHGNQSKLFITSLTAMDEVHGFDCIGMGEPLARHLIRPEYSVAMPYCNALPLAAYALALVKDSVRDLSVFTLLGNDGTESTTTSEPVCEWNLCSQVERYAKWYDFLTKSEPEVKNIDARNPSAVTCFNPDGAALRPPKQYRSSAQQDQSAHSEMDRGGD